MSNNKINQTDELFFYKKPLRIRDEFNNFIKEINDENPIKITNFKLSNYEIDEIKSNYMIDKDVLIQQLKSHITDYYEEPYSLNQTIDFLIYDLNELEDLKKTLNYIKNKISYNFVLIKLVPGLNEIKNNYKIYREMTEDKNYISSSKLFMDYLKDTLIKFQDNNKELKELLDIYIEFIDRLNF